MELKRGIYVEEAVSTGNYYLQTSIILKYIRHKYLRRCTFENFAKYNNRRALKELKNRSRLLYEKGGLLFQLYNRADATYTLENAFYCFAHMENVDLFVFIYDGT